MDAGAGRHVTSALRIVTRRLIDLCRLRSRVTLVVLLNLICVIWIGLFCRPPPGFKTLPKFMPFSKLEYRVAPPSGVWEQS